MHLPYKILLYYCYTSIDNPKKFRTEHHLFCLKNNLKGRIIIAKEGINGTVSGLVDDCDKYMKYMKSDLRFAHMDFKENAHQKHAFAKLNVRLKKEIVNFGVKDIDTKKSAKYVTAQELPYLKDTILLDARSNYEHKLGKFKNAVILDINNLRELPHKLSLLRKYSDKKIVTYCTGGVKCEKTSAFLIQEGFKNIFQLKGGIIRYGLDTDGEDFEGKCYVFDNRISVDINKKSPNIISKCYICDIKSDRILNCANPSCNRHVAICVDCANRYKGACSVKCKNAPNIRKYNEKGYYTKKLNGYNPYKGLYRDKNL